MICKILNPFGWDIYHDVAETTTIIKNLLFDFITFLSLKTLNVFVELGNSDYMRYFYDVVIYSRVTGILEHKL